MSDGRLLCVVELRGTFVVWGPPGGAEPSRFSLFYKVFDGRTGNLLLEFAGQPRTQQALARLIENRPASGGGQAVP